MAIIEVSKQITNYLDSEQTASAPANPVEGQRWTDTSKSPPVAMIYTEGDWKPERLSVEVLDPDFYQDLEDTKTEVAAAIEKAEAADKAGKDAQAAGEAAQSAASEAKLAGENAANLATQATLDAQAAKDKADAIQIDVNGLVSDIATINGTVTSISSKANEAYEKAAAVEGRTATLETSVTGLTGRMTDIETTSTSTTKKLNELVVTVDGQKQTIATVTATADSALSKANVLETTVDGVTRTISSVQEIVDNQKGATRNYLKNSESPRMTSYLNANPTYTMNQSVPEWKATNAVRHKVLAGVGDHATIFGTMGAGRLVEAGTYYVHSIYVSNVGSNQLRISNNLGKTINVEPGEIKRVVFPASSQAGGTASMQFVFSRASKDLEMEFILWHAMIADGTIVSSWVPNPDEQATVTQVNTISETVDGHTQLIASTKTTADSALVKATQVETTANGLKTTISSVESTANTALTKATQVEATANGLTTTVTNIQSDINNLSTATRNLLTKTATLADRLSGSLDASNVYNGNATLKGTFSSNYVDTFRQKTASIPRDGKFTVTFWAKSDRNINFNNYFYGTGTTTNVVNSDGKSGTGSDGNNVLAATTSWKRYWITWTQQSASANKEIILGRIFSAGSLWINSPMLIEGTIPTDWAPAPEDMATISQITQLSDQMNFKLTSSDGGVTQIDMQNQIVTISSENIYLTGKSNISDAIIKTAHIADLAVSNGKIANLAVTEGKIGNLAVTTAKIADLAVNNAKIASLDAAKINTGYLAAARIAASSITTDKLNVATLSAITANLGNVTAGTINGLEIIGGSYTQSATMTDPNSGKSGISEIKLASGVLTNSFNSTDSSVSRQTTLSSGVLRFLNLGSEFGRLQSNGDKGSSTVPALEVSGTFIAITSSQRGWINLSANGIFEGNTYSGYSVDAGSNTGNYVGFNRNSSDKMNFFAGKTADGTKRMGSDDLYASSGSGKALHITSGGSIVAYSSSERFKEYIETASDVNPKSLLNLDLKSWIYKSSHSLVSVGEPIRRVYGLIAEDVERVGLNQYVERDINGRVEGYKPELWTVTIPILKEHEESIEALKQKVKKLEGKIEALQAA